MRLLLYALTLLPVVAFAQKDNEKDALAEKYVLALSERKFQWLIEKQYDSLEVLLHNEVKYIHSNGWVETKAEVLRDLRSGKLNYQKVKVSEASAASSGKTVVVTGKGVFEVLMDGKHIEVLLLYTEVYVKTKKRWKLLGRHACKLS